MYPANHFALFPPFARDGSVFVGMSFDPRFDRRWNDVIVPAISNVALGDRTLLAHRIDLSQRGDSILSEILDEVARCRLVFADITTIGVLAGQTVRNANVLYEVGLAHSVRLPEEVILVRSDNDSLPFDVANVRVHSYSPDDEPARGREIVTQLCRSALKTIVSERARTVRRVAETLDFECFDILYEISSEGPVRHPGRADIKAGMGLVRFFPRMAGIQRLLEVGAIATQYQTMTSRHIGDYSELPKQDLVRYVSTPFGQALLQYILETMDYFRGDLRDAFEAEKARSPAL